MSAIVSDQFAGGRSWPFRRLRACLMESRPQSHRCYGSENAMADVSRILYVFMLSQNSEEF
jgi:hypothetical protein